MLVGTAVRMPGRQGTRTPDYVDTKGLVYVYIHKLCTNYFDKSNNVHSN